MPSKSVLTQKDISYINAMRLQISGAAIAKNLGVGSSVVCRYMRKNGLTVSQELKIKFRSAPLVGRTSFSTEDDQFILNNYLTTPIKRIAAEIGRSYTGVMNRLKAMGLTVPEDVILRNKNNSRIQKGNIPPNKGRKQTEYMSAEAIERSKVNQFKKGNIPPNTYQQDGVIVIRKGHPKRQEKPSKWIRISLSQWVPLSRHIWQNANGPIPKGMCIWFIDQNPMNCTIENLELISQRENMARNTISRYPPELKKTIKLLSKLNKTTTHAEKQTDRSE